MSSGRGQVAAVAAKSSGTSTSVKSGTPAVAKDICRSVLG